MEIIANTNVGAKAHLGTGSINLEKYLKVSRFSTDSAEINSIAQLNKNEIDTVDMVSTFEEFTIERKIHRMSQVQTSLYMNLFSENIV